jgi:hypothetical protein
LVIDVRAGIKANFQNRYNRLLQSVNGNNIKADIFTLNGNVEATGPALVSGGPDDAKPVYEDGEIDLNAWAKNLGYTMLLIATPVS